MTVFLFCFFSACIPAGLYLKREGHVPEERVLGLCRYVYMCIHVYMCICNAKVNIPGFVLLWVLESARAAYKERSEKQVLIHCNFFFYFYFFLLRCIYNISKVLLTTVEEGLSLLCVYVTFHIVLCIKVDPT